ncbi:hypothetical protein RDI58_010533 [Solanum bulbocastanum]|uniref:Retrotransposon gag domain-containing protein n=1 Tax=Solanum bulbocastanum TaxID=147425 RepID=A0AAN8TUK8_SOLBU
MPSTCPSMWSILFCWLMATMCEAILAQFIPRSVRDSLRDQSSRLEQDSMMVSEYEVRFHELSRRATMILPTKEERVQWFVHWLRLQLQIETRSMVCTGHSFLDVVDHAHTIEELRHKTKRAAIRKPTMRL